MDEFENTNFVHRTFSVPMLPSSPGLQRTRSPYAVDFPLSAKLKPLNLGNPFDAPGSQLRRRKTMPSIVLAEHESTAPGDAAEDSTVPAFEPTRDSPLPDTTQNTATKKIKRRSRSAGDLRQSLTEGQQHPARKRSDEIRFWRESYQGSVLRTSGFITGESRDTEYKDNLAQRPDEHTSAAGSNEAPNTRQSRSGTFETFRSSPPPHGPTFSQTDMRSASGYGTELSRDLEDRVAKLESGLHHFQRSLARLTADRNRSTVMIGGRQHRRSSLDARTPSMLADTLSDPLTLAYAVYGQPEETRPLTSPQPPRTPERSTALKRPPVPPLPLDTGRAWDFPTVPSPRPARGPTSHPLLPTEADTSRFQTDHSTQPQPHTVRSLYEMLSDERSARRRLEGQIRGMRREITDLQFHVSSSQVQSQRSSFMPAPVPEHAVVSSRLAELLRETEESPSRAHHGHPGADEPAAAHQQRAGALLRDSGDTVFTTNSGGQGGLMSRFSHSDSEAGGLRDSTAEMELEPQTPCEAYQTPMEERRRFPFGGRGGEAEGEMGAGAGGERVDMF
ncbi:hypothetical protein LTR62_001558 [Meristemomyces frigidus]|uniref:Uncharacterized protein n=1 Tax=Meristemomyces frigidus TaxID=1508187 RepID=A0AAN7YLS3_9PEZI|nr:hypothetical protein LTR62_001558 [Meristemomyces frigidus]